MECKHRWIELNKGCTYNPTGECERPDGPCEDHELPEVVMKEKTYTIAKCERCKRKDVVVDGQSQCGCKLHFIVDPINGLSSWYAHGHVDAAESFALANINDWRDAWGAGIDLIVMRQRELHSVFIHVDFDSGPVTKASKRGECPVLSSIDLADVTLEAE